MPRESTAGTIYAGYFHRTMDAKNRVTIPSNWLNGEEGEVLWIIPDLNKNYLRVMPTAEFARQEETLDAMLPPGRKREEAKRYFYAVARQVESDKQGRILLAADLCEKAGITANVTFVGVKTKFEIWDAAKWSSASGPEAALSDETRTALEAIGL